LLIEYVGAAEVTPVKLINAPAIVDTSTLGTRMWY
jgi:hypothetical protein